MRSGARKQGDRRLGWQGRCSEAMLARVHAWSGQCAFEVEERLQADHDGFDMPSVVDGEGAAPTMRRRCHSSKPPTKPSMPLTAITSADSASASTIETFCRRNSAT